jgi:DNA-directed RNA polymerase subunit RPC12/RpoP
MAAEHEYRCQFCGKLAPVSEWLSGGEECPHCHKHYDAQRAADEETE